MLFRLILTRLQLFTVHSHTVLFVRRPSNKVDFFFWKLKPVFDRFLVGCCCYCYFIIIVIMNEWCILSIVYIFGATERDTVQHFH